MTAETCPGCGRALDLHDRHWRFRLPDPVLALPEREATAGSWLSHETANESVMMQVPNVGAFVRALLPVKLTEGHTLTFGVWLAIEPGQLQPIFETWWAPSYRDLRVRGWLGNGIPPWGLLAAPVDAVVRDVEQTPYCAQSSDPLLRTVLHDEWPHDLVLGAIDGG